MNTESIKTINIFLVAVILAAVYGAFVFGLLSILSSIYGNNIITVILISTLVIANFVYWLVFKNIYGAKIQNATIIFLFFSIISLFVAANGF